MLAIDWHERSASYDEYKYLTFLTGKLWTDLGDILLANLLQCLNLLGVNGHIYQYFFCRTQEGPSDRWLSDLCTYVCTYVRTGNREVIDRPGTDIACNSGTVF